jgi:hypothetical protein
MWVSTPLPLLERVRATALVVALALGPVTAAGAAVAGGAPPLPRSVTELAPNLQVQGGGQLTFFGIAVYDGWYWSSSRGWPASGPYALDLVYHRDLDGGKIAQRSVDEITRLGYGTPEQRARWGTLMARIFPDVRRGDRITGVHTDTGVVRYFYNGQAIGAIEEPGFAQAFFAIWLDPKSSRADFRQKLLGQP